MRFVSSSPSNLTLRVNMSVDRIKNFGLKSYMFFLIRLIVATQWVVFCQILSSFCNTGYFRFFIISQVLMWSFSCQGRFLVNKTKRKILRRRRKKRWTYNVLLTHIKKMAKKTLNKLKKLFCFWEDKTFIYFPRGFT